MMAGLERTVGFLLVLVFLAVIVPSVNGSCSSDSDCSPGRCHLSQCECPDGNTDPNCAVDSCSPTCRNGGICRRYSSYIYCDCPSGYSGSYCQSRGCSPPCRNGGSCSSGTCDCPNGYSGAYCQQHNSNSLCSPSCENGGTCSSGVCSCTTEYHGSYCQLSSSSGGTTGIVFGGVFGGIVFITCIVGITVLRICLRVAAVRRRTQNVEADRVVGTGVGRRVIVVQRVCRVPPTNPDAPPPYVPSTDVQSTDPPPYAANPANCPIPTSTQDTPTPQPLPPESSPSIPNDDDPTPEYLPPPGSNHEMQPLLEEEQ